MPLTYCLAFALHRCSNFVQELLDPTAVQKMLCTNNVCQRNHVVVSLNYCSQNGGNVYRAPYYHGNPNIGPRIMEFRPIPMYHTINNTKFSSWLGVSKTCSELSSPQQPHRVTWNCLVDSEMQQVGCCSNFASGLRSRNYLMYCPFLGWMVDCLRQTKESDA